MQDCDQYRSVTNCDPHLGAVNLDPHVGPPKRADKKICGVTCILFLLMMLALVLTLVLYYEPAPIPPGMCKVYD